VGDSELEKIARLAARLGAPGPGIALGIGDDAAVLDPTRLAGASGPGGRRLVWTIDEQTEGTHFRRELVGYNDLGFRSFMAAASDVAAMGAEPWCALCALALPGDFDDAALDDLAEGQRAAAETVGAPIVGGNLTRAAMVSITTTLLGSCDEPITRRGARPGDRLWIAGSVGLARAGFLALERGLRDRRLRGAIAAWQRPMARIDDGRAMAKTAHAAIDVSDGLARDAMQLALASGVCVVVGEERLQAHTGAALARAAEALGTEALDLALHGGEDYALLAASDRSIEGFTEIGVVRDGEGLLLAGPSGERVLAPEGFDHFASAL
jgi:thiamine-monophosphate kinase